MEFASTSPLNPSFSLAAASSSIGLGDQGNLLTPLQTRSGVSPWVSAATSLVFVDRGVQDYQSLVQGLGAQTEVYVLDPTQDAITQITNELLKHSGIESVHILSHGAAGELRLGSQWLGADQLLSHTAQLKSWSQALATGADVLLYGCDVAEGSIGQAFVQELSQLAHADVAASNNITGAGGDWTLEVSTGQISAKLLGNASYHYSLGSTQLLSQALPSLSSATAGGDIGPGMVSDDGRYVVFTSPSDSVTAGDSNGLQDVFLYDRQANTYTLVSHNASNTGSGNGTSKNPVISGDGNYVAFVSSASNLASGITDSNGVDDVFLWSRSTGQITLLSAVGNQSADGFSGAPVINQNGSVVAFTSASQNLLGPGISDNDGSGQDVFVWTRASGVATLVSLNLAGTGTGNRGSGNPVVSRDGSYIAFVSTASDLAINDKNGFQADVFVYGVNTGSLDLVSVDPTGFSSTTGSVNGTPSISADGSRIAFSTSAALLPNDTNSVSDIYLWQRDAGGNVTISLESINTTGQAGNGISGAPVLSADGKAIAFVSAASDLVAGDSNGVQDVFWRDLSTSPAGTGTRLISHNGSTLGNGASNNPVLSLDGQTVAFASVATNLVANDTNGQSDIFAYSVASDALTLASQEQGVTPPTVGDGIAANLALSGNGQFVLFSSSSTNLVPQDTDGINDVFSFDLLAQSLSVVSQRDPNLNSVTGQGSSTVSLGNSSSSADGRYVVFTSAVDNLVTGDSNGKTDVFLRDTTLPSTDPASIRLISHISGGTTSGNDSSLSPVISADGNYVVFVSYASNLVAGDTNGQPDVFLYNRQTDTLTLISQSSAGASNGASLNPSISADGSAIVFTSTASNLVAGQTDSNNAADVFLWTATNGLQLVSHNSANASQAGNSNSSTPVISSNGRYVIFVSNASDLVAGDANGVADVFAFDTQTGQVTLLSTGVNGIGNGASSSPVISDDGRYVAFVSSASNLVNGDTNGTTDVFRYDLQAISNPLSLVSVNLSGNAGTTSGSTIVAGSFAPTISADGRYIAFASTASDLTSIADTNGNTADVFVRDMQTGQTTLISVNQAGTGSGNAIGLGSTNPVISGDGSYVAFTSTASDLTASDNNGNIQDVFVRNWQSGTPSTRLVSIDSAGTNAGNADSTAPVLSRSGNYIAFSSNASNLVPQDFNQSSDVFGQTLKPLLSLTVTDAQAQVGVNDQGFYQLKRDDTSAPLTVTLAPLADSTAPLGEYTITSNDSGVTVSRDPNTGLVTVTLAAGVATANLILTASSIGTAEPDTTVDLAIVADPNYAVSSSSSGVVTILANGTVVTNTNDSGAGSLRQAILNANSVIGLDTIRFQISGTGTQTIALQSALPNISDSVIIDGRTQTGYAGTPLIILNGSGISGQANGLSLMSDGSAIKGLGITGFSGNGIYISGNNNIVGLSGTETDSADVISGNAQAGVYVVSGNNNRISGNSIVNNSALGIDLAPTGVTPNDLGDADTGPNALQNFPVLSFAEPTSGGSNTTIAGQLNGAANQTFRIEFFSNTSADPTGNGEGQTYLGFQDVTTDGTGNANIQFTTPTAVTGFITATAIDATGDTSEFSAAVQVSTPTIAIVPSVASQLEGNSGTTPYNFTVTLSQASTQTVTVNYATQDGTATLANSDYIQTSGQLTFAPGQTTQTIAVPIVGDTVQELNETFSVDLSNASNATLGTQATATGVIQNDDGLIVSLGASPISQLEGNTGTTPYTPYTFTVTLSQSPLTAVTIDYATQDGTATVTNNDYVATSGTLTFNPGETSKTITVNVNGDTTYENDETFQVVLSNPSSGLILGTSTETGVIQNDDTQPTLSITADQASVKEGNSGTIPTTFTVSLSQASGLPVTVNYATQDGTATIANNDYVATTGALTFNPGETTKTITVNVNGDTTYENDETFSVVLTNPNGATLSTSTATETITNDDLQPTVSITADQASVKEGNSGTTPTTFTVSLSAASGLPVTIDYATQDGTATTANNDYAATNGTLTFNPGETTKTITVNVNGDTTYEGDETFNVVLTNPNGATLGTSTATETIADDDTAPVLNFAATNVSNPEGQSGTTSFVFTLNLSQASGAPVTVNYATQDGTATVANNDYVAASGTLTFNPGETSKTITVNVNGDTTYENDETFNLLLSNVTGATLGTPTTAIGTIVNDDTQPSVSITADQASVKEGNSGTTPMTFTVSLSAASGLPVTVNYATQDGTATTANNDYAATNGTLTFNPGETTKTITVNINGDTTYENDETFNVILTNPNGATLGTSTATETIANDDLQPTVSITADQASVKEGNSGTTPTTFTVSLSAASGLPVTIDYATQDGTATTANNDYAATNGTLTFNPGETTKTITVNVNGDTTYEGDETFNVVLTNPNGATLGTSTATETIADDDTAPVLSFAATNVSNPEGQSGTTPFVFTLNLSQASGAPVTVNYATQDGTATVANNDYVATNGTLTFNPGETSKTITVNVNGDTTAESDETFNLLLSNVTGATLGTPTTVTGTIVNDDTQPSVSITADQASVKEGNSGTTPMTFTVSLSAASGLPVTVNYATQDGTATTANNDYAATNGTLTFNPGETTKTITVNINGDTTYENDETFNVILTNPNGATLGTSTATETIANDDLQPTVSITADQASVKEGNSGTTPTTFTVSLSAASGLPVTIDYATQDGTATTANNDYAATNGTLTFNPGETTKTITVNVNGDTTYENDETFNVVLTNPNGATLGSSTATETILNDDLQPTVSIAAMQPSVLEGNSGTPPTTFTVNLSAASSLPVTVNYATQDGTATLANNDYAATNGTLTFNPGETSKTITVNVNGDTTYENNETFNVILTNPTGATLGTATATETILNDDPQPTISITADQASVKEGNSGKTPTTFTVSLSAASGTPVTVNYATQDGTATIANNDYAVTNGTLTFNPGETSKTITVNVNGDTTYENDETFNVVLTNPTGATLSTTTATETIVNDDTQPTVSIAATQASVLEGNVGVTQTTFTVSLSQASGLPVTVSYATQDGTATVANNDYMASNGTLTFNPGETSKTITVNVNGDTIYEPNETFNVVLTNPSGATLGTATVTETILNDDPMNTKLTNDGSVDLLWHNTNTGDVAFWQTNRTATASQYSLQAMSDRAWQVQGNGDFNGDGSTDVLWRNTRTGENQIWLMNGPNVAQVVPLLTVSDLGWQIAGIGDFNGDRKLDILWYYRTGLVAVWTMNGTTLDKASYIYDIGNNDWAPQGVADFNGDQIADILWRNQVTGAMGIWQMATDGTNMQIGQVINLPSVAAAAWKVSGIADFNGDRRPDILWRNYRTGEDLIWRLNNGQYVDYLSLLTVPEANWEIRGVGDLNQDGSTDIFWRNKTSQQDVVWYLNNGSYGLGLYLPSAPSNWSIATVGNFGTDGIPDVFWVNDVTGDTYVWTLNPSPFGQAVPVLQVGDLAWKAQLTGDFNGDGSTDIFWRNQRTGENAFWLMRNGQIIGTASNIPQVPDLAWQVQGSADFDRDGNLDILWRNQSTGDVAIWKMNGTNFVSSVYLPRVANLAWQIQGIADFDGDGYSDILWRNSQTGEDLVWKMNGTAFQQGMSLTTVADTSWQIKGIADFNRDGKPDLLWLNVATGAVAIWTLSNFSILQANIVGSAPSGTWQIQGVRDFDGGGQPDILWGNSASGETLVWYMNGTSFGAAVSLLSYSDAQNWRIEGINNFGLS